MEVVWTAAGWTGKAAGVPLANCVCVLSFAAARTPAMLVLADGLGRVNEKHDAVPARSLAGETSVKLTPSAAYLTAKNAGAGPGVVHCTPSCCPPEKV